MIRVATEKDYPVLIDVWEQSVRATHHFLPEDYLQEIKLMLPAIFPSVTMYVYVDESKQLLGFTGVADGKIEMLFLIPEARGKGIGKILLHYSMHILGAYELDVNEQNEQAVGFYRHMGFAVIERKETDGLGRPFPLLSMKYTQ
ncbi:acetyltransferase [Lacibacter sediminis]|uniref:Acetyltransferase n=1 Tax=Lacibacter sediminis TaxID=2760713 RepID=A0A7G5XCA9_9BACT|nr:acetyltransferase [Lacibacter sediminis]QNA43112.1 acetyltransferase [Lacibacter sediminis]